MSYLQQFLKMVSFASPDEEAVGVMAIGQRYTANAHSLLSEPASQRFCRLLAAVVAVGVEGQIDGSRAVAQLVKLPDIEIRS